MEGSETETGFPRVYLGCLLACCLYFDFLGFYGLCKIGRGAEVAFTLAFVEAWPAARYIIVWYMLV